jgi:peptidoglycan-N-acetylglucosamine deacetylase
MSGDKKELYLTFDDGPVPGPTEFVIETLAKHSLEATFFCIGDNIRKHSDIFQKVLSKGHAVGNHTFHHLKGWETDTSDYLQNISLCDQEIANQTPADLSRKNQTTLFRPPYGRITRKQIRALADRKIVMWDVLTQDYSASLASDKCLSFSLKAVRNGSIVVFHDSWKAEKNLKYVLPRFIDHCLDHGYTFKKLV